MGKNISFWLSFSSSVHFGFGLLSRHSMISAPPPPIAPVTPAGQEERNATKQRTDGVRVKTRITRLQE